MKQNVFTPPDCTVCRIRNRTDGIIHCQSLFCKLRFTLITVQYLILSHPVGHRAFSERAAAQPCSCWALQGGGGARGLAAAVPSTSGSSHCTDTVSSNALCSIPKENCNVECCPNSVGHVVLYEVTKMKVCLNTVAHSLRQ